MKFLQEPGNLKEPRIAVFGKFNHGKSTLLNTLTGEDIFKVADIRETTKISEHLHNGIIWVDSPGLDADTEGEDDKKAREAASKIADFLLLVHNVKAGELDKDENQLYEDLKKQDKKMLLVLTQIDQKEKIDLDKVIETIKNQVKDLTIIPVSATRYQKGIAEQKPKLIEMSGIIELKKLTDELKTNINKKRSSEINNLTNEIITNLDKKRKEIKDSLESMKKAKDQKFNEFTNETKEFIKSI